MALYDVQCLNMLSTPMVHLLSTSQFFLRTVLKKKKNVCTHFEHPMSKFAMFEKLDKLVL